MLTSCRPSQHRLAFLRVDDGLRGASLRAGLGLGELLPRRVARPRRFALWGSPDRPRGRFGLPDRASKCDCYDLFEIR